MKTDVLKFGTRPNWNAMYDLIKKMRSEIVAPVDTIGCASLAEKSESPKIIRFQILVSLLLSSQTKDEITAAAVARLKTYPGGLNCPTMKHADEEKLAEIIKPVGFYRRKAKNLVQIANILSEKYQEDIPPTAEDMMALPGIGPKMAHLAMQHAWDMYSFANILICLDTDCRNSGIGVDVHVHRISNRLGWVNTKEPEETRIELESFLPKDKWKEINHLLVGFGQTICSAKKPSCDRCLLNQTCPSSTVKAKTPSKKRSRSEKDL